MYVVNIVSQNTQSVLYRILNILIRKKINIESINAYEIRSEKVFQITLVAEIKSETINTVIKQMDKIIEVLQITYYKTCR